MASDSSSDDGGLLGVLVGALIVLIFGYFVFGDLVGLRSTGPEASGYVEVTRAPDPPPAPQ